MYMCQMNEELMRALSQHGQHQLKQQSSQSLPRVPWASFGLISVHECIHCLQSFGPNLAPLLPHLKCLPYALQDAHPHHTFRWDHREGEGEWWFLSSSRLSYLGKLMHSTKNKPWQGCRIVDQAPQLCVSVRGIFDILCSWHPAQSTVFPSTSEK